MPSLFLASFIVISSDVLHIQLSFGVFGGQQLSGNILKLFFFWGVYFFQVSLPWVYFSKQLLRKGTNDNWNFGFSCFGPEMAVSWPVSVFKNVFVETPFNSVLWVRAFWAKLSKRDFWTKKRKQNILIDNWKAHFWGILSFFLVFFEGLIVRWGGPKGSPHLALNPPYLFWFVMFCFLLLFTFLRLSLVLFFLCCF